MLRRTIAAVALLASSSCAHAEVWMVKSSGTLGCRDRQTLIELEARPPLEMDATAPPSGCTVLYSGERLLDVPHVGEGFTDYMKVQRADGTILFVRTSATVPDPGIGSVTDDRSE